MDGAFYHDTRAPFIISDLAAVTLSTTDKALYTISAIPIPGPQYWWPGKKAKLRVFGKITTGATPGNITVSLYFGTGADANGVVLAASATVALTASQTNLSWEVELYIRCVTGGSAGTFEVTGKMLANNAVIANTLQPLLIPASAAAPSAACDLTASNLVLSLQAKRTGSTAETMTVQDLEFSAMN